jgi:predicted site-specific integrase-resolvase
MNQAELRAPETGCDRLLSRNEVASILRITIRTVNNWVTQGYLNPVRIPKRRRALGYRHSDIQNILKSKA